MRKFLLGIIFLSVHYMAFAQSYDPGTIGNNQTIYFRTAPASLTFISATSGGTVPYTYQWQRSDDSGITFYDLSGETQTVFTSESLSDITFFRCRVTDGSSLSVNTNAVKITIWNVGAIGNSQIIVPRTAPQPLSFITAPTGQTIPYYFQWQESDDNGATFYDLDGANLATYSPITLASRTLFRCRVSDAANFNRLTNTVIIDMRSSLVAGTIGSSQSVCYETAPAAFTVTEASGGTPPYEYQWQYSEGGTTWLTISGATSASYSPPALTSDRWYRRWVRDASGRAITSNTVQIAVYPVLTGGTIGSDQTIYSGASPNALTETQPASGGSGSLTYQWQSSADGSGWSDIAGATSVGFTPPALDANTWYRRIVVDGTCGSVASNSVLIFVINSVTLFTTETPVEPGRDYMTQFDLGTRFEVLSSGFITKARLYTSSWEGGSHQIRFWRLNSQGTYELIAGPFDWSFSSGQSGWREMDLPNPITADAGQVYMISITTGENVFAYSPDFTPVSSNSYIRYLRSNYTPSIGNAPNSVMSNDLESYFRDIVFIPFSPGIAGVSTTICNNTAPPTLEQISAPSGGFGLPYTYQWQNSTNGTVWYNIEGATSSSYSPPVLTVTSNYRRVVSSGGYSINGPQVNIRVNVPFTSAQFNSSMEIYENSSTYLNVVLTGGTPPYTINYSRDGVAQTALTNYTSGTGIFTGLLNGTYVYTLTSVIDAFGCTPGTLGNSVTVDATLTGSITNTNKALLIVNSSVVTPDGLGWYDGFLLRIKPYFDWFGIPYDLWDIATNPILPDFNNYALIIFGHRNVYYADYIGEGQQEYPINSLETAINNGVGLFSFDVHLFDFPSAFNITGGNLAVTSGTVNINPTHYITQYHNDLYASNNSTVYLKNQASIVIGASGYTLSNGVSLATMSDATNSAPLLQAGTYGLGKIVKWSTYTWMMEGYLGPVYGMDDLIWRGIVWAARKPFVMQGIPPMITVRIDDVDGNRAQNMLNFSWLDIFNENGFIPWLGLLTNELSPSNIDRLRVKISNKLATSSPHAFGYEDYIYYDVDGPTAGFNSRTNVLAAWNFFSSHGLQVSNYVLPHYYLMDEQAVDALAEIGVKFIGNVISYRDYPLVTDPAIAGFNYPGPWLNGGPYRLLGRDGTANRGQPLFYAGNVTLSGNTFFNCLTEIGDDSPYGYEWYPSLGTPTEAVYRGVRHLRRALDGMFMPVLFTHENQMTMDAATWDQILKGVINGVSTYNPEFRSMDYAVQYLKAKEDLEITNVTDHPSFVNISCSGVNDMGTRCYLFTESDNQISSRLVDLPTVSSTSTPVTVAVPK